MVGSVTLLASIALLIRMRLKPESDDVFIDYELGQDDGSAPHGLWRTLGWFLGLLVLTGLFGFIIGLAFFLPLFFRVRARVSWTKTILLSVGGIGFILALAYILGRDFPGGALQAFTNFPWPFR